MPEYKCVFVENDKKTVTGSLHSVGASETKSIDADTPSDAANIYQQSANQWKGIGPYVRVRDENGQEYIFRFSKDEHGKIQAIEDLRQDVNEDYDANDAKQAAEEEIESKKKQAGAKQAAQSSLSSTDLLLKELIKEQKSTNGKIDRIYWSLVVLTAAAIMPIYRLLKKWDSL